MPVPVSALKNLLLLAHLPHVTVEHLAHQATGQWFSKREVVLHKGHQATHFCFLIEGRLQGVVYTHEGKDVGLPSSTVQRVEIAMQPLKSTTWQ